MCRHSCSTPDNILFITGTGTGVGKTVLTALLVAHLRVGGREALAMKPFCSGGLHDPRILRRAQGDSLSLERISPFHFEQPIAPAVAARQSGRSILIDDVLERITTTANGCEQLLVEGAGGLLTPLGNNYTAADLIAALRCQVVVVAPNKLGTVNHVLLTLAALRPTHAPPARVVLMNAQSPDLSADSNPGLIRQFAPEPVFPLPHLGRRPVSTSALHGHAKELKKALAQIGKIDTLTTAFRNGPRGWSKAPPGE